MYIRELYKNYFLEFSGLGADALGFEEFRTVFGPRLEKMEKVSLDEPWGKGILYYRLFEEGECMIPAWGYYASSGKVLTMLFTRLAERLVSRKTTHFSVHLYAHDTDAQQQFAMMQFGYMAETGIMRASLPHRDSSQCIRTLDKEEIAMNWAEIWPMTAAIIDHLRQAPIFYPGKEFTEEVYRDFFLDEGTHLHGAFDPAGKLIGMIETNEESCDMLREDARSANIGEVYVPAALRGSSLSNALLYYALEYEKSRGAQYLWVEHGTATPNARAFWGKYFDTYEYELDRTIVKV